MKSDDDDDLTEMKKGIIKGDQQNPRFVKSEDNGDGDDEEEEEEEDKRLDFSSFLRVDSFDSVSLSLSTTFIFSSLFKFNSDH